jgi:hypothetical protein
MEKKGLERWRIAKAWGSFAYYDEPRSYYDPTKKDIFFYGKERKIGRPSAKKSCKKK